MFPPRKQSGIASLFMCQLILYLVLLQTVVIQADVLVVSQRTNLTVRVIDDIPAVFSAVIPTEGITGLLVYSEPANACRPIRPPPFAGDGRNPKWIVLIRKYGCRLSAKLLNAQQAGYSAAIVHNINSNNIQKIDFDEDSEIRIPAVVIGHDDGDDLHFKYTYERGYSIKINDEVPDIYYVDVDKYIFPFLCVLGICFLTTIATLMVKCIKDQRRTRRNRLSSGHLKKLPVRRFVKGDQYDTCAVCLEEYSEGEKIRELPCCHVYHIKCIDPWLTKNKRTCPVCKRKVFPAGSVPSDSDDDATTPLIRAASTNTGQPATVVFPSGSTASRLYVFHQDVELGGQAGASQRYGSLDTTRAARWEINGSRRSDVTSAEGATNQEARNVQL